MKTWIAFGVLVGALALAGCSQKPAQPSPQGPQVVSVSYGETRSEDVPQDRIYYLPSPAHIRAVVKNTANVQWRLYPLDPTAAQPLAILSPKETARGEWTLDWSEPSRERVRLTLYAEVLPGVPDNPVFHTEGDRRWAPIASVTVVGASAAPPPPKGFVPASIAFWDATRGLVAGSDGCPDKCTGVIKSTGDGGKTWQEVYRGATQVSSLSVIAGQEGWAQSSACGEADCRQTLLHTRDGGKSWASIDQPVRFPSFADADHGWAVSDAGLVATADGGRSWQPLAAPCQSATHEARAVHRLSPTQGWVGCVGQPGAGQQMKAVYATTDGGKTWQAATSPGGGGYLSGLFFLPDGHGWLWESRGASLATADGGKTWLPMSITRAEVVEAYSLWFASPRTGFALLRDNEKRVWSLVSTMDGGSHWAPVTSWPI